MNQKPRHKQVSERALQRLDAQLRAREHQRAEAHPDRPMPVMVKPKPGDRFPGLF